MTRAAAGLWLAIALPSADVAGKFLGNLGVAGYALTSALIAWWGYRRELTERHAVMSERMALIGVWGILLVLGVAFWVAYPLVDAGVVGGGSDRDDALQIGVEALLAGRFPYYSATYLGNPLAPLPGAFFLSAPWSLLPTVALQNLYWLGGYAFAAYWLFGRWRSVFLSLLVLCVFAPVLLHALVTGSDYIANGLAVLTFILLTVYASGKARWIGWTAALLLGVALSWRANFVLLAPLVFSALLYREGFAPALGRVSIVMAAFATVTLPFYLHDPASFAPLYVQNKVQFSDVLPYSSLFVLALTAVVAILLARQDNSVARRLLRNCFWVMITPVIAVVLLASVQAGAPDFRMAGYGLSALFFGVLGYWPIADEVLAVEGDAGRD